ncbi:MAG: endo-1,4-beta-xylanase [Armatimonadetes bacterium]|nr:endo-1,4-beta-xylanase [Armatimonadota bacterium]
MLRRLSFVVVLCAVARADPVLYRQDFEQLPDGPASAAVVKDNTWTGDHTTYRIAATGAAAGKALEIGVSSFAQMVLHTPVPVEEGKTYRFRCSVAARGRHGFTLMIRQQPSPYTAYASVDDEANETWKTIDQVVTVGQSDPNAALMVMIRGQGAFWLGELELSEYSGAPPVQEPPLLGNMVQNAAFELGWDGWFSRDESFWSPSHVPGRSRLVDDPVASGRHAVELTGDVSLSAACQPVAYGQRYTLAATVRADYPDASLQLTMAGPSAVYRSAAVPEGRWTRVAVTAAIGGPRGRVVARPFAAPWLFARTPPGKHVWVDDVAFYAGEPVEFHPRSASEAALTCTAPNGLVVAGQPVELRVTVAQTEERRPGPLTVERLDEHGRSAGRYPVQLGAPVANGGFRMFSASLRLPFLPPGHWRLVSHHGVPLASEGEALVTVAPRLPAATPFAWQAGIHPGQDPIRGDSPYRAHPVYGARWGRLHDVCVATKWPFLEPRQGDWQWAKADAEIDGYLKAGYRILGLLDGVPGWRKPDGKPSWSAMTYPDDDFADWERYVRATVAHFRGRIDAWEVMNEPVYAGQGPTGKANEAWYVELLQHAHTAAKAADARAYLVGGGGAAGPVKGDEWWQRAAEAGIFRYCDAVSFHGYGRATTQVLGGPQPLLDYMAWMRELMAAHGGRVLPVWDTEVGLSPSSSSRKFWLPNRGPEEPLECARQVAVTLLCERAAGVAKTFFYAAFAYRLSEDTQLCMFCEVNDQLTPLAAALGVCASQIEGLAPAGVAKPSAAVTILTFRGGGRTVRAVWTTQGEEEVSLPAGAKPSAIGLFGRPVPVRVRGGKAVLTAGREPVYVSMPQ